MTESIRTTIYIGDRGGILHVNRAHIALNAKDNGRRPVYTLKPDGPNSKPIYARKMSWQGHTSAVADEGQLKCGARAWLEIAPGAFVTLVDQMDFTEAKDAV